ncbi:cytochrome P450 [Myceligenerans cantabricum]
MFATASTSPRLDDLTHLTPLAAATAARDPQPIYAALEREWGPVVPVELEQGVPAWLVLKYDEIVSVLKDQVTFSRDVTYWRAFWDGRVKPGSGLHAFFAPKKNAYFSDGETHHRYRRAVEDAFDRVNERRLARAVRQVCDHMLNQICADGEADLVASYTGVVPSLAVAAMYGLGMDEATTMLRLAHDIFSGTERAAPAFVAMNTMLADLIDDRRHHSGPDLLSSLVHHDAKLTQEELIDTAQMIQSAGNEMAVAWATAAIVHLVTDGDFAGRVTGGRLMVDEALNTVLIHQSPTQHTPARFATADAELAGRFIKQGDAVVTAVAEASAAKHRDADPLETSGSQAHLAFGTGPHRCPAARLSHIIIKTAVTRVMERLPGLKLAVPASDLERARTLWSRYAPNLPVTFTPTQPYVPANRPEGIFHL